MVGRDVSDVVSTGSEPVVSAAGGGADDEGPLPHPTSSARSTSDVRMGAR
jgi:hypothetical protein